MMLLQEAIQHHPQYHTTSDSYADFMSTALTFDYIPYTLYSCNLRGDVGILTGTKIKLLEFECIGKTELLVFGYIGNNVLANRVIGVRMYRRTELLVFGCVG